MLQAVGGDNGGGGGDGEDDSGDCGVCSCDQSWTDKRGTGLLDAMVPATAGCS